VGVCGFESRPGHAIVPRSSLPGFSVHSFSAHGFVARVSLPVCRCLCVVARVSLPVCRRACVVPAGAPRGLCGSAPRASRALARRSAMRRLGRLTLDPRASAVPCQPQTKGRAFGACPSSARRPPVVSRSLRDPRASAVPCQRKPRAGPSAPALLPRGAPGVSRNLAPEPDIPGISPSTRDDRRPIGQERLLTFVCDQLVRATRSIPRNKPHNGRPAAADQSRDRSAARGASIAPSTVDLPAPGVPAGRGARGLPAR
jgi:hypothetical protein